MAKFSGVYLVTNEITGEQYVGSSKNVWTRIGRHVDLLQAGVHDNPLLQAAWQQYGERAFDFKVVEDVPEVANLRTREQAWIDTIHPVYNRIQLASGQPIGHTAGRHQSVEARAKISEALRGRSTGPFTDERRANISAGKRGKPLGPPSEEHKRKLSDANKGQDTSKAAEASANARRGTHLTDEQKQKIGEALKGRKRPPRTAEQIENYRRAALERQARQRTEQEE